MHHGRHSHDCAPAAGGPPFEVTPAPAARPAPSGPGAYGGGLFFLCGFGSTEKYLGPGAVRTCPNCGNTTPWNRVRVVKQLTVFFLPVARWGRRRLEVCGICGTAVEV